MRRTLVTRDLALCVRSHLFRRHRHAQDAAQVKKGEEVYAAQKCSVCHAIAGKGSKANPLDGVGKKLAPTTSRRGSSPRPK